MCSLIHPSATAVLIRQGTPRFQTLHDAIDTLARAEERLEEEVWDVVEQVDDGEGEGKLVGGEGDWRRRGREGELRDGVGEVPHTEGRRGKFSVMMNDRNEVCADGQAAPSDRIEFVFVLEEC